jgi:hypothetical protein
MAVIQATVAITPNPLLDRKKAVGKNTKWKVKLPEPSPALLRGQSRTVGITMFIPSFEMLKKNGHRKPILIAVVTDL